MSDEEFREDVKAAVRRHDPSAEELRTLASDLQTLADRYDEQEAVL